jgi:ectoine hydroxylase-related dioxygenase (phytanoyl-CoA dioxygenase family)
MNVLDQLKTFGYAIDRGAVPVDICDKLGSTLDNIESRKRADKSIYDVGIQAIIYSLHLEEPDAFIPHIDGSPIFDVAQQVLSNGQQIIMNSLSASRSVRASKAPDGDPWRAHIDTRMPAPDFGHTESIVAMICVDDFSRESGAVRLWPYTHLSGMRPPPSLHTNDLPGAVQIEASRGSVVYWLGQTWHAISPNLSGVRRWGIISQYTYWWIKPSFDYTHCGAEIYRRLTPRQRGLLGFSSRPPISPDIRIFTVTKPEDLPQDYEQAMRPDFASGQAPATAHKTADVKG